MSKKLMEKAGLIQMPPAAAPRDAATPSEPKPKTAPGSMLQFMGSQSAAVKEAEALRERVKEFDGALPARLLDPQRVRGSKWANRDEANFSGGDYLAHREEIKAAGGNVQAIKVRPLRPATATADYEIVYGHRRHRACLDLGLPVLAVIEDLDEQSLFVQMERENRSRKDLSAWEQGLMYARALDEGLYPSNRQLALAINRDLGDVGKALALARLPKAVIDAFASPLDLQFRWAKPLNDAQQADPEGLLKRARELAKHNPRLPASQVLSRLIKAEGKGVGPSNPPVVAIERDGKLLASISRDGRDRVHVMFAAGSVGESEMSKLAQHLKSFFKD